MSALGYTKTMRVIDLFSGIGGLSLGLQNAGYTLVLAADNWDSVVTIYRANFNHPVINIDLSDVKNSVQEIGTYNADMIVGGPPCQDYSSAGKRNEENGRADLTISFAEIIRAVKPQFFIMENVDQIVKSKRYSDALVIFKKAGYGTTARTLDASLCGVPQKRKRHFVVGSLRHADGFLDDTLAKNLSATSTTIRDYLGDKFGLEHYYRHPRNYNRRGVYSIDEPSPTVRGVNRPLPQGYPGHHNDTTKNLSTVRPLTTKERSLLQTFPENFQLIGTKSVTEQAIGNAVPVKLAEYVAACLNEFLGVAHEMPTIAGFKPMYQPLALET